MLSKSRDDWRKRIKTAKPAADAALRAIKHHPAGYYTSTQLRSDLAPQFKPRIADDAIDLLNYFTKEIAFSHKEGADKGEYHIRLIESVGLAPLEQKVS
ncbi:MAG: hypothetical protein ACLPW4_13135 [Candidatus Sulfotelmatobacter sp.]